MCARLGAHPINLNAGLCNRTLMVESPGLFTTSTSQYIATSNFPALCSHYTLASVSNMMSVIDNTQCMLLCHLSFIRNMTKCKPFPITGRGCWEWQHECQKLWTNSSVKVVDIISLKVLLLNALISNLCWNYSSTTVKWEQFGTRAFSLQTRACLLWKYHKQVIHLFKSSLSEVPLYSVLTA